ncbi:hypothetical protein [Lyngbya sp. PCC 8106]|uniref:hypothetical protein n=1 Tax=Lyngbya sp. (strain PCC 8106) TaxID=313612 RepID=UPI0000EABCC3|nr:hypothetical protein [Lyngbya sp. PCC 8106]EAW35567.1 hypothetical protein L8106_13190 [Lyngbya sp. PCC 8106]
MKLLKLPRILALTLTVILASVVAIAQTVLGLHQTPRLIAQLIGTSNSTPVEHQNSTPFVSLNQISAELSQSAINSTSVNNHPLIAQTDSHQSQTPYSGCNCPQCQGVSI